MRALDINVAGEFVVMAATLLLIKSRMLLPVDERTDAADDDAEPIDPRLDLVRQLVEYKRYKDAANTFAQREVLRAATYPKGLLQIDCRRRWMLQRRSWAILARLN